MQLLSYKRCKKKALMKPILLLWLMLYLSVVANGEKFNLVGTLEKQSGEMVDLLQGRSDVYYITDSSGMEKWACLPGDAHHSPDCRDRYTGFLAYKKLPYVLITLQSGGQIKFDTVRECSVTNRDPESMYRTDVFCRSEERRVGKECRSRWSRYH